MRQRLRSKGREQDACSGWKRVEKFKPGERAAIKRRLRRRARHDAKRPQKGPRADPACGRACCDDDVDWRPATYD